MPEPVPNKTANDERNPDEECGDDQNPLTGVDGGFLPTSLPRWDIGTSNEVCGDSSPG